VNRTGSDPIIHLAPLQGITNRIFRTAYDAHFSGIDAMMAPFLPAVDPVRLPLKRLKDLVPEACGTVPQILANDAACFLAVAAVLADLGYGEVNWNLGCPHPAVANKRRGSGLLPFPSLVERFLDGVCAKAGPRISVKLRLGRRDPGEILELMPVLNAFPLKRIILHPRVGVQMYRGGVDLDGFARAAAVCRHELMYNGDIKDPQTFRSLQARFPGVRGWMIGRWVVADPFLPAKIKGMAPAADPTSSIRAFHGDLYAAYRAALCGPAHVLDKMGEVWSLLGGSFPHCRKALGRIRHARTFDAYECAVREILGS